VTSSVDLWQPAVVQRIVKLHGEEEHAGAADASTKEVARQGARPVAVGGTRLVSAMVLEFS
jgi:hypothetical protein